MNRPLEGIIALDFSQYLAGPSAALRLADLGARVIKVENPKTGDSSRHLSLKNMVYDGDSVNFQAINRDKESFAANLKDPEDLKLVKALVKKADVLIENFRPGIMAKFGLDYESASVLNPRLVYATVTGYGAEGPWSTRPGQDLLVQSLSGLCWLNGNQSQPPLPMSVGITDIMAGEHLAQGILSGLYRRSVNGEGMRVDVSLLESALDIQFEGFTAFLNDHELPVRSSVNNANAYVAAPYGIYSTSDGYMALAMTPIPPLAKLLSCAELESYTDPAGWSLQRDEIKSILVRHLRGQTTDYWLSLLEPADIWCARVMTWDELMASEGFRLLDMVQKTVTGGGVTVETLACPIRIDGRRYKNGKSAPKLGEHDDAALHALLQP